MATQERRGAVAVGGEHTDRRRAAWLKWLIPLLALIALVVLLIALLGGGDDGSTKGATTGGSAGAGSLTAADTAFLPAKAGVFEGHAGEQASGKAVKVVAVNPQEGFWVGTSADDRAYIEYGDVRKDEPKGAYQPAVGDLVNLSGPVRAAPSDPVSALNLQDRRDGELITQQGGFVNADEVTKAG